MSARKFTLTYEVTYELEIDESVFAAVTPEWRSTFYRLDTDEDVARHVAFNVALHDRRFSSLDGWANLPDAAVRVLRDAAVRVSCEETKPNPKAARKTGAKR